MNRFFRRMMTVTAAMTALGTLEAPAGNEATDDRGPDILLIVVDDLGCRDLGAEGHDRHLTPTLDALAADSIRFTNASCNAANCAPSRAAIMTGRHGSRTGVHTVGSPKRGKPANRRVEPPTNKRVIDDDEFTIAEALRGAGYQTGFIGKWHLGLDPLSQGFDLNVGGSGAGHPKSYQPPYRNPALTDGPEDEYLVDRLGRETASMIRGFESDVDQRPWFVVYAPFAVHTPIQAPEAAIDAMRARHPELSIRKARYAVMVERTDMAIAEVLAAIDPSETVVCFVSDNGGLQPVTEMSPWRGGKGMLYEGGIRTPMYVRVPGVAPREEPMPVQAFDLYPTLLDLAGLQPPADRIIDAKSLRPLVEAPDVPFERGPLFWHFPVYLEGYDPESREPARGFRTTPSGAIRDGRWKLIEWFEDGEVVLYNLKADPGEKVDLASVRPRIRDRLLGALRGWRAGINAPMPTPLTAK
mgnify:CR=1 FL=1